MSNDVSNRLKIHCEDIATMEKIKTMIFDKDENNKQIFTMSKMLPLPEKFSGTEGYNDYGCYWCLAIWGTKWDAYNCNIIVFGNTLTIHYTTATSTNDTWVKLLCNYIQMTLYAETREDIPPISVELQYHDYLMNYGGILEWEPFTNTKTKEFSFKEYAQLYDQELYKYYSDLEDEMRSKNDARNGI